MGPAQGSPFTFDFTFPLAVAWGLIIIAAFVGWGTFVGRRLVGGWAKGDGDFGLSAAWGMATFLVFAGVLIALSAFSKLFIVCYVAAGIVFFANYWFRGEMKLVGPLPHERWLKFALIGVCLFAGVRYLVSAASHWYNEYDDFVAYFRHATMLLQTGTLSDPFDFRLIGSLGGQQTLSTLVLAFLPWKYASIFDSGISLLILVWMTQEVVRGNDAARWTARLVLAAFVLFLYIPRVNSACELTGAVLFLALIRTLDLFAFRPKAGFGEAIIAAGVLMAAGTLRCNYVFAAGAIGGFFFLHHIWEDKERRGEAIRNAAVTFAATAAFLTPWSIAQFRSSGVFLYPLVKGNQQPEFDIYTIHLTTLGILEFLGGFLVTTNYLLLFFPLLFLRPSRQRTILAIHAFAILFISIPCILHLTNALYFEVYRYLAPIALALCLSALGLLAQEIVAEWEHPADRPRIKFVLVFSGIISAVIFVGAILPHENYYFFRQDKHFLDSHRNVFDARNGLADLSLHPISLTEEASDYTEAFSHISPDGKTLIALDYPFLLDYRAHQIVSIDVPGVVSPSPGFPYYQGAQAVKRYLLDHGIRYIAHVPFDYDSGGYSRYIQLHPRWNKVTPVVSKHELDFMDNVEELERTNRVLYKSPTIVLLELAD
jgi:hypothetical protein